MGIKKENGITLVALVITIIVMLILAGVSLSMTIGENGILTQAKKAREEYIDATVEEEIAMAWVSCEADYMAAKNGNANLNKKDFFEGNNGNKGLKNYLTNPENVENFTYNDSGTSMLDLKNDEGTNKHLGIEPNGEIREIKTIEFTIDGKTYYAEEGMNWVEWARSSYNSDFVFLCDWYCDNKPSYAGLCRIDSMDTSDDWLGRTPNKVEGVGDVYKYYETARVVIGIRSSNNYASDIITDKSLYTTTLKEFSDTPRL